MPQSVATPDFLLSLPDYVRSSPPREPFVCKQTHVAYLAPHVRFRLMEEVTSDIGYGLGRCEELAAQGVSDADVDARGFAQALFSALEPTLSPHTLRELAILFQARSQQWDAELAQRRANQS